MTDFKAMGFSRIPNPDARLILIAIDGSSHSKRAFNFYLENLYQPNDALTIYHAIEPIALPSFSLANPSNIPVGDWSRMVQNNVNTVRDLENDYSVECQRRNINFRFIYESVTQIGEAIVKNASKHSHRLIIIGTRGLGALKRTIMGSVSDYVVHHSKVSVCVVPGVED